jgi:hypothetical protein
MLALDCWQTMLDRSYNRSDRTVKMTVTTSGGEEPKA